MWTHLLRQRGIVQLVKGGSILRLNGQNVPVIVHAREGLSRKVPERLVHLGVLVVVHQLLGLVPVLVVRGVASLATADLETRRLHALASLRGIGVSEAHLY